MCMEIIIIFQNEINFKQEINEHLIRQQSQIISSFNIKGQLNAYSFSLTDLV
jgi:hypothetical protein